jgi:hypothetical protein
MGFDAAVERARSAISGGPPDERLLAKRSRQKLEALLPKVEAALNTRRLTVGYAEGEAVADGQTLLAITQRKTGIDIAFIGWLDFGYFLGVNSGAIVDEAGLFPDTGDDMSEESMEIEAERLEEEQALDFYSLGPIGSEDVFLAAMSEVLPVLVAILESSFAPVN